METKSTLAQLMALAIEYDAGDPARIQHFIKVHDFAAAIAVLEGIDEETQYILESAAILHDIGIHVSEEKYGSDDGKYQEIEGPAIAETILQKTGAYSRKQIERIKYLIAHHHTYTDIQGMDYQILVEADFLVNLFEKNSTDEAILNAEKTIFKTASGKKMLNDMFLKMR